MTDTREVRILGCWVSSPRYHLTPIYVGDNPSRWKLRRAVRRMEKRVDEFRNYLTERSASSNGDER